MLAHAHTFFSKSYKNKLIAIGLIITVVCLAPLVLPVILYKLAHPPPFSTAGRIKEEATDQKRRAGALACKIQKLNYLGWVCTSQGGEKIKF